ncbi:sphingosine-1-phosphate lyase 1-like [Corticium candelabrum]|uniref:sphingosine-1-phosphate lyase 1-like n=1 Tax=Corticium candelabrum TaxID=121492 RepID=UPI002E26E36B|nr:sphingosine-1-phosphate lyase 1-like [Corticium candelabrum]
MTDILQILNDLLLRSLTQYAERLRLFANSSLSGLEPWQILAYGVGLTLLFAGVYDLLFNWPVPLTTRVRAAFFTFVRRLPIIGALIQAQLEKTVMTVKRTIVSRDKSQVYRTELPKGGMSRDELMREIETMEKLLQPVHNNWKAGRVSGAVYHGGNELTEMLTEIYGRCAWANPLHPDVFPHVRKMEAEVVQMCVKLFNGGEDGCGSMTSGGTESILMACLSYRQEGYARGVRYPEIVAPVSCHAAFEKAAHYFQMKLVHIPVDSETRKCDVRAMARAINKNTVVVVASAPHFPHGIIDPVEEIAKLAMKHNVGCHVDCCLGGFLLPFMEDAGFPVAPFDFRVPGVTSISCDTHKYGFAPKGSSVVLYHSRELRARQFFVSTDWQGGIYATPTLAGSRAGSVIAGCWATLMLMGKSGYVDATRKIISTAKKIEEAVRKIDGVYVLGEPQMSVIAIGSNDFDIYRLAGALTQRGWNLNSLQFPPSVHICCTLPHTKEGVAELLISDIQECVAEIMKHPAEKSTGSAAIYGLAQSIPDRNLVKDIALAFLDACLIADPEDASKSDNHD